MRQAATTANPPRATALPRGWVIVGLALAAWVLVILAVQLAIPLFWLIAAAI